VDQRERKGRAKRRDPGDMKTTEEKKTTLRKGLRSHPDLVRE
jgi:hypothetical protein